MLAMILLCCACKLSYFIGSDLSVPLASRMCHHLPQRLFDSRVGTEPVSMQLLTQGSIVAKRFPVTTIILVSG